MSELIETKCEYCVNPIGIDCVHPRLSWKLPQGGTQTAYRVLVSASREMLEAGKGDLFDTGVVSPTALSLRITAERTCFQAEMPVAGVDLFGRKLY